MVKKYVISVVAVSALAALALSGCSGGTSSNPTGSGDPVKMTSVTVGTVSVADVANFDVAVKQGFFVDHGLNVKAQSLQGGSALIPALESGSVNFGFANIVSVLQASEKGLGAQCIAGGVRKPADGAGLPLMIAPKNDGSVKTAKDLEGKTIAVNTAGNVLELLARIWLKDNGADPSKVNFVTVAFPDMPASLSRGLVDAAVLDEPYSTIARQAGVKTLNPRLYQVLGKSPLWNCWVGNGTWLKEHHAAAQGLVDALNEANDYIKANPNYVREILPDATGIDPKVAADMTIPVFDTALSRSDLQLWLDATNKFGYTKGAIDLSKVVYQLK